MQLTIVLKNLIRRFKINAILHKINAVKQKGMSAYLLFAFLLKLVFTHKIFSQRFQVGAKLFRSKKTRFTGFSAMQVYSMGRVCSGGCECGYSGD